LPEISRVCKIPANKRIFGRTLFLRFQDIGPGCCTVAAHYPASGISERDRGHAKLRPFTAASARKKYSRKLPAVLNLCPGCSSFHRSNHAFQGAGSRYPSSLSRSQTKRATSRGLAVLGSFRLLGACFRSSRKARRTSSSGNQGGIVSFKRHCEFRGQLPCFRQPPREPEKHGGNGGMAGTP
jgi:hypothetical protein